MSDSRVEQTRLTRESNSIRLHYGVCAQRKGLARQVDAGYFVPLLIPCSGRNRFSSDGELYTRTLGKCYRRYRHILTRAPVDVLYCILVGSR